MAMGGSRTPKGTYLALDRLTANRSLARRLPADMAWHFHALPLAEDNGCITVAMADPEDSTAREAVASALGTALCVVQGDPVVIDTLLGQIWAAKSNECLTLLTVGFHDTVTDEVWSYARALATVLGARVLRPGTPDESGGQVEGLSPAKEHPAHDLAVVGRVEPAQIRRLLSEGRDRAASWGRNGAPYGVLTVRKPQWPLAKILLVLCGEEGDCAALDWVLRLARGSGSAVTVLAVVPPVPAMYGQRAGSAQDLAGLLTSNTTLGQQMRSSAQQLVDEGIRGTLRLRQGPPDWQVCREVAEGDYDLIGVAEGPCSRWLRWLQGDFVSHLLCRLDRSVLIVTPPSV
jgi:nucleotide-binding universal stress UspA family protein